MHRKICPRCRTGKELYELDPKDVCCPYQMCVKGRRCPMFVPVLKEKKESIIKKFLRLF